jgi:hypothetical protein
MGPWENGACRLPAGEIMRLTLLALALAAVSFTFTAAGASSYRAHDPQNCVTKRFRMADAHGRTVTKRVRICG